MSWQLAAFALLGVALAAGFGWYERARPDARIVALVATLAALAALGRIAFAALPNVKPTTDIVLISGYALGGAPGFAIGAIAGLTSNFFFGQGPWTPWQMAAWGATGIIGAGLAIATGRRIGRWPLAAVCGITGFAFAAIQDIGDWVTYSDHSAAALGVYVGKGIGFDLVHAAGCVLFALAFGPAMIRSIQRFARRLQVVWGPAAGTVTVLVVLICAASLAVGQSFGGGATASAASSPAGYLLAAQNGDGGFGPAVGQGSSALFSGWAALGLAAAGHNPGDVNRAGRSLLGYIETAGAGDPGSIERTILVARAAGANPRAFGGQDLVARLATDIRSDGSVGDQVNLTSFAVLALRAAGSPPPARTLSWLVRQQDRDGGFNFAAAGGSSDVDDTGAALQALSGAGGRAARAARRGVGFIVAQQNRDGGLPSQPGAGSNAQSTAWAIQGLVAAGVDPGSLHRRGAPSPLSYLNSMITADGHVRYSRFSDQTPVWVTGQALMALARKPLPLAPVARAPRPRATHRTPRRPHPAVVHRASRPAQKHRHPVRRSARPRPPQLDHLAADAALVAAIALGPVGLG